MRHQKEGSQSQEDQRLGRQGSQRYRSYTMALKKVGPQGGGRGFLRDLGWIHAGPVGRLDTGPRTIHTRGGQRLG